MISLYITCDHFICVVNLVLSIICQVPVNPAFQIKYLHHGRHKKYIGGHFTHRHLSPNLAKIVLWELDNYFLFKYKQYNSNKTSSNKEVSTGLKPNDPTGLGNTRISESHLKPWY